jgi:hypothetical protein
MSVDHHSVYCRHVKPDNKTSDLDVRDAAGAGPGAALPAAAGRITAIDLKRRREMTPNGDDPETIRCCR